MARPITPENQAKHWLRSRRLMWVILTIWAIFAFISHFFVEYLNEITVMGFPLGFYMSAQGALIVFVILIFVYSALQDGIDEACDAAED